MRHATRVICVIFLAIIVLLNLPLTAIIRVRSGVHDNVAPFQNAVSVIMNKCRESMLVMKDSQGAMTEKKRMQEQIVNLEYQIRELAALERDNEELRTQLEFKTKEKKQLVLCEVIMRGGMSGWWQSLTLNRGSGDGIRADMAVVTVDGLIGCTISVSKHTAEVLLITDPSCRVACRFVRTGAFGVMSGRGVSMNGNAMSYEMICEAKPNKIDYISKGQEVQEDDEVVTSGLGGVYPEGLPVGRVAKIVEHSSRLYYIAHILPAANMRTMNYVFVVMDAEK